MEVPSPFLSTIKPDSISLTQREKEILIHIINGYTNCEIAGKLHISNRTVDTHRQNILYKLGARNTATLVRFALENVQVLGLQ